MTPQVAADETALRHVLAHEATHYRHGDPLWAVVRGACLVVHWWNPLVWRLPPDMVVAAVRGETGRVWAQLRAISVRP